MIFKKGNKMVLTVRGSLFILAILPFFIIAALHFDPLGVFIIGNSLVLTVILIDFNNTPGSQEIIINRDIEDVWQLRQQRVFIKITNDSLLDIVGACRDTPPNGFAEAPLLSWYVPAGQEKLSEYEILPKQRGAHEFGAIFVEVLSPWGLVKRTWKVEETGQVEVIPDLLFLQKMRGITSLLQSDSMYSKHRVLRAGTDFSQVREYVVGDEQKRINWRVSAKNNKLYSNVFEVEKNQIIWLVLDAGRRMLIHTDGKRAFEHGISAVLALTQAAIDNGDQVGLIIAADTIQKVIHPRSGKQQLSTVLQALAASQPMRKETNYLNVAKYLGVHMRKRGMVCVVSEIGGIVNDSWTWRAFTNLRKMHLVLLLAIESQGTLKWINRWPNDLESIFNKAAALLRRGQHKNMVANLLRSGVEVVSVEAGKLASASVHAYFEVKERV